MTSLGSTPVTHRKGSSTRGSHDDLYKRAKNTISAASRLIRRKIPQSGHLMISKRFWMHSVPNQDVDVVIIFPPESAESTVLWFKSRIEAKIPEVKLKTKAVTISKGTKTKPNCYAFHLSCSSYKGYLEGLEEMQIPKPIRDDLGGGTKEFTMKEASNFSGIEDMSTFLSSQERQSIILHYLHSLRAEKGDTVGKLKFRDGEAIISRSQSAKLIYQVFPIHDYDVMQKLQKSWVKKVLARQPIGDICEYFGVQIALYFAWLGHYTTALFIPATVGIFFWVFFCGESQFLEDIGFVIFAFFNVIWATLYLESWKRRSAELAYTWGTADQRDELLAEPRPQFKGVERISEITGKPELYYPEWKRNCFRYFVTVPVIGFCLLVVFVSVFVILELQQWWDHVIKTQGYMDFLSYLPKILLAVVIPMLDGMYNNIAIWLNDMENYKLEENYDDQLVIKLILFQFVNSFLALFYIAFYLQDMDKLKELLAALLITRQVIGNVKESLIPYLKKHMKIAKLSFDIYGAISPTEEKKKLLKDDSVQDQDANVSDNDANHEGSKDKDNEDISSLKSDRTLSQVEFESSAPEYEGTFEDYLEMFIQFGYVTLFSSAYPLAGLCALLNNLIEIRGDAFKLCFVHQRPFGARVKSIGSWQTAMELMGVVGVIVNCALIGQSGQVHRMFPSITSTQTIILIIVLEHVLLLLKVWISYAIPDIPSWVATEMAKIEWKRREAEKITSNTVSGLTPESSVDTTDKSMQTEPRTLPLSSPTSASANVNLNYENRPKIGDVIDCGGSSQSSLELEQFKEAVSRSTNEVFTKSSHMQDVIRTKENLESFEDDLRKQEEDLRTRRLKQRMASDTDLWMSVKAAQARYQSTLETTRESPSASSAEVTASSLVLNPSDDLLKTPDLTGENGTKLRKKSAPSPSNKRVLTQEEFDKHLKAKRQLFSKKGRSLSLASFTTPVTSAAKKVVRLPIEKLKHSAASPSKMPKSLTIKEEKHQADERYLQANRPQGELESVGLESLINVNDVKK